MNIYQKIQKRLGKKQATPAVGEAQAAADVLRAKTGKATSSTGPRASNVAEQAAVDAARTGAQQQQQTGMALAQQVKDRAKALTQQRQVGEGALATERETVESGLRTAAQASGMARTGQATRARAEMTAREKAQIREVQSKYDRLLKGLASQRRIQEGEIYSTYKKGTLELADRADAHEIWMITQAKALATQQYLQRITQVGGLNRLHDQGLFQMEAQRLTLGDKISNLMQQMNWQEAYNGRARDFAEEIGSMDLDTAMQIADASMEADVASGLIGAGGKLASNYEWEDAEEDTTSDVGDTERSGPGDY